MDSAETAEDPEDAEAEEKLHFKTGSRRFPRRFKMLCSIWAARCSADTDERFQPLRVFACDLQPDIGTIAESQQVDGGKM